MLQVHQYIYTSIHILFHAHVLALAYTKDQQYIQTCIFIVIIVVVLQIGVGSSY